MTAATTPLEALALDLIAVPSVIGTEAALADHVEAWARARAFARLVRAGDNLLLEPRPRREGHARLLLLGHLDTVPAADANPPRLEGGRLYGLGASDMKSGDALILHLLAKALDSGPPPALDLCGVLYAREEGSFDESGLPEIVRAAPDAFEGVGLAIAMEPTDNHFEMGCLGTLHATVSFHGRRAHSARPWEGRNAIHLAVPLLSRIAGLEPRDLDYGGLTYREVCSVTMVAYEGARNVVPGRCDLNVNFRFGPDRTGEAAGAWLTGLVRDAVGGEAVDRGTVTLEVTDLCPAGRVCSTNPVFRSLRDTAGTAAEMRAKQAWTDVGRLSEMGIDAVNFGPGSPSQAHQAGEYCLRSRLEDARLLFERWLWP